MPPFAERSVKTRQQFPQFLLRKTFGNCCNLTKNFTIVKLALMRRLRYYCLLTLLCGILYLPGLANLPLFDRDEPHFAQATRQMLETKNYLQINFQLQPRHLKPPGIYWLQAAAVHAFNQGKSFATWPYRLPSVLGAWLAVIMTFAFSRRITDEKTAALAATLLACAALLIIEAHLAVTDAMLLATMVAMQFALGQIYYNYYRQQRMGWLWPIIFWLAMAAGVLIKGITPLIGGLTILGLYIADRQTAWLKSLRWHWGIPFLLLLTAAWLIPVSLATTDNFLWDMIHNDVLPKITGGQQSHGMPPGYLSLIFTATFWPASLFIVPTGIWAWRHRRELIVRFLLAWIIPAWIFFELVPTKLPEYLLPVYPAVALLTAFTLMASAKQLMNKWVLILSIFQRVLWILGTAALTIGVIRLGGWGWLTAGLIILGASILLYIYYHPTLYSRAIIGVIIAACAFMPVWQMVLPNLRQIWLSPMITAEIGKTAPSAVDDTNPLLDVDYGEPSLVFLMGTYRVLNIRIADAIDRAQQSPQSVLLISQQDFPCFSELSQRKI